MTTTDILQKLLDERGWTIYRLSKEAGIPYSSLSNIFNRGNEPTLPMLKKICAGMDITLLDFFSEETDAVHRTEKDDNSAEINFKEVGARLRARREALGYSREKLSEIVEISAQFIADIEAGRKGMSAATLIAMSKGLSMSVEEILYGKSSNHESVITDTDEELLSIFHMLKPKEQKNGLDIIRLYAKSLALR